MNYIFSLFFVLLCFFSCTPLKREMPIYVKSPSRHVWQSWIQDSFNYSQSPLLPNSEHYYRDGSECGDFPIAGGIASHHQLIAPIFINYYRELAKIKPDITTFFIIGPDHFRKSRDRIAIGTESFYWGRMKVRVNKRAANELIEFLSIRNDPYPFKGEHTVLCHIPFIASFFPLAEVVPVIIDQNLIMSTCRNVSAYIRCYIKNDPGCFVLLSIDFSHHLNPDETKNRDAVSLGILREMNPEFTREITCDSPKSWYIFTNIFSENLSCMDIYYYTTNEHFLKQSLPDITSYFFTFLKTP